MHVDSITPSRPLRFSIILPARNGEKYLAQALTTAVEQTRPADEILVVDDASVDGTPQIATSERWCGKVRYHRHGESTGFVDAWNRSAEAATGDFITLLHQDDMLHRDYLAHVEKALLNHAGVRHAYTACNIIDADSRLIRKAPGPLDLKPVRYTGSAYARNYLHGVVLNRHIHRCPGVTTSRELMTGACRYRKAAGLIADDDFFYRVGRFTDVIGITYPLASFREHPGSTTRRQESLAFCLARDYVFQACCHSKSDVFLGGSHSETFNRLATKFISRLLFQGLLDGRREWVNCAHLLLRELDEIAAGSKGRNPSLWVRTMWRLAAPDRRTDRWAVLYVKSLHRIVRLRGYLSPLRWAGGPRFNPGRWDPDSR